VKHILGTAAVALAAAIGAPAFAECPAPESAAVQAGVNIVLAAEAQNADFNVLTARAAALAKECSKNAYVQKAAALVFNKAFNASKNGAEALSRADLAWSYLLAMRAASNGNEPPVLVMINNNQPSEFGVYQEPDPKESILGNLFSIEMATGALASQHLPVKAGEKLRACGMYDYGDASTASHIMQNNAAVDIPPALNMLDRLIAICTPKMSKTSSERYMLGMRARVAVKRVKAKPDRPDAMALLQQAQADSKAFATLDPDYDLVYWSKSDAEELDALILKRKQDAAPTPAEADWFKPGNPENPKVVAAIAAKLDAAWKIDEPLWTGGKFETYRKVMGELQDRMYKSNNLPAARAAIYAAAKGQSDGSLRSAETKGLRAPPDFLWNFLKPAAN